MINGDDMKRGFNELLKHPEKLFPGAEISYPADINCEYCNAVNSTTLPVLIIRTEENCLIGAAGKTTVACQNCKAQFEVTWDGFRIALAIED